MTLEYLRLAEKPGLHHPGYPTCGACYEETEPEDMSWLCPSCGTTWPVDNLEADPDAASLFEEWSGEKLTGLTCPNDIAWRVAGRKPKDREEVLKRLLGKEDQA